MTLAPAALVVSRSMAAGAALAFSVTAALAERDIEKGCGAGFYRNVDGLCIHDPYSAPHGGETALCRDGSHSMSQHRRGTCSGHGGVAQWEVQLPP